MRNSAKTQLNRGRVEATLSKATTEKQQPPAIDDQELQALLANAHHAQALMKNFNGSIDIANEGSLDVFEVLRWPGVLKQETTLSEHVQSEINDAFVDVLVKLVESRETEGESLRELFIKRLSGIRHALDQLAAHSENQIEFVREKLSQRVEKLGANVEPSRVAQEVALLAQRADVNEEIDRLNVHITEFETCMQRPGPQGRRLGFIVQEMARESNTLAAKLAAPDAVNITVDLKVLIDQIREQVQNVE